jgi:uncharacterized protein
MILEVLLLGFGVGILVGLLGIGGGIVLVPSLAYLLGMEQHLAQGTSLLPQLAPVGAGALYQYWKAGYVDWRAGMMCAVGALLGGHLGSLIALRTSSNHLRGLFGVLLMVTAAAIWPERPKPPRQRKGRTDRRGQLWRVFALATGVGVLAGLFGVGGGSLLVPLLVLLCAFEQHEAQGTSLVALVPPTGLLAFLNYAKAGEVNWTVGLLLIPGVFSGGWLGARLAQNFSPSRMRRVFAALLFAFGAWQALTSRGG